MALSVEFADFCRSRGVTAGVLGLKGNPTKYTDVHPRWNQVWRQHRRHFITTVGDVCVDWTARQFDPAASVPVFYNDREQAIKGWDSSDVWFNGSDDLYGNGTPTLLPPSKVA
jgi:hypothetical protein